MTSQTTKSGETTSGMKNLAFQVEPSDVVMELGDSDLVTRNNTNNNAMTLSPMRRPRTVSELSAFSESSFRYLPSDDDYDQIAPLPTIIVLNDNNNNSPNQNGRMPRNFSLPNNFTTRRSSAFTADGRRRSSVHPNPRQETYANRRMSRMNLRRGSVISIAEEEDEGPKELILKIRKTLPLKDFRQEVRAHRDIEKFLVQPVVLLDCPHTALESIIEALMEKLQKDLEVDEKITSQASKGFFTFKRADLDTLASVDQLKETIQGVRYSSEGSIYEESWITALCSLNEIKRSHVGIARLRHPLNFGNKCEEISFVIGIIAPKKEKFTKNAVEIGRTFSSLMSNVHFRRKLMEAQTDEDFKQVLKDQSNSYNRQVESEFIRDEYQSAEEDFDECHDYPFWHFGRGLVGDVKRRLPFYISDFTDGIRGKNTIRKVLSTIFFLYFACLLPDIAFGKLYEKNTNGVIGVSFCVMSQTFGGLMFGFFGGQPLVIMLTTAPLALYVKVIFMVSELMETDFRAMYAMVGLWNSFFLFIMATFNASNLMKYSTRSTEEIFAFFIALTFTADAIKETISDFQKNYHFGSQAALAAANNVTDGTLENCISKNFCFRPENSILFLFLMLGTLWLGFILIKFETSQFLSATKREYIADYALPLSVIIFSFIGSYLFKEVNLEPFNYVPGSIQLVRAPLEKLNAGAIFASMGLGLCLSALFFVDDNVCSQLITAPQNKLQKGTSHHWDLFIVGLINAILSIFGLPWVHSALPHSPLHVRALADVEQHVTSFGTVQDEIVRVRETRVTGIVSSLMIGLSLLFLPHLRNIPVSVLQGLFLYLGLTSFNGNQLFDRLMLVFTEGSSYPPNHYVRKVPQRKLHFFTFCQIVQLAIVCGFGFAPQFYLKMVFPVLIIMLLPIRQKFLPKLIEERYLMVIDT